MEAGVVKSDVLQKTGAWGLSSRMLGQWKEKLIEWLLLVAALTSVAITVGIVGVLVYESIGFFRQVPLLDFLTDRQWTPLFSDPHYGILSLVSGTVVTTAVALAVAAVRIGEQLVARSHCSLVAGRMACVARFEGQHQAVQEATPVPRGAGEQPVHHGREPEHRKPFAERIGGGGRPVDADLTTLGGGWDRPCSDIDLVKARRDRKPAVAAFAGHLR